MTAIRFIGLVALVYGPPWLVLHYVSTGWAACIAAALWPFLLTAAVIRVLWPSGDRT